MQIADALIIVVNMEKLNYFIGFDDYSDVKLAEFEQAIKNANKKQVGSITIAELCSVSEYPNGIYLLFDESDILWYVDKATSRSFIERIPAHFDPLEEAWFNSLPKSIMKKGSLDYASALQKALTLRICLIGIKDKVVASRLETVLRSYLKPELNTCKGSFQADDELGLIINH